MTNPGFKKVVRFYSSDGMMEADALAHRSEDLRDPEILIIDPNNPLRRKKLSARARLELLCPIVSSGDVVYDFPSLLDIRSRRIDQLAHLHDSYRRLHMPHEYKVGLTYTLWHQKEQMFDQEIV
jgi:nicotinate phosphoribosyltransferase